LTRLHKVKELILGKLEKELPLHLTYHNIEHTKDVMQAVAILAGNKKIGANEKELLLTAALFHDTGFLIKRDEHEAESCNIARNYLPLYGYTPTEIEQICDLIMATRIPQSPGNRLAEILCDADLDYLGRDDFFTLSTKLFAELNSEGIIKGENEWDREQANFMENHHYFTKTAVDLHQSKKERHIELIKSRITTKVFNENQ